MVLYGLIMYENFLYKTFTSFPRLAWHDTLWPGQVPVGSDIWGSARWSEAPRFGCPTRTRRPSQTFHIFPIIPYHFATLLYIWKRSTEYCGTYWQDKLCLLSSSRIGFCIIPQFKFGQTSWIWGLVDLVGVQGAHSQREERRNDDERWETQVGYDMPWFHHNLNAKSHSWNQTLWRMKANDTILLGLYSDKL